MILNGKMLMKRHYFFLFTGLILFCANANAKEPKPLTQEQERILEKIEKYFNGIKSMQSDFVQSSTSGAFTQGTVSISKPNKMRLTYQPPTPVEIVADGEYLIFHDKKLGQVTHMDLDSNPAAFMLEENFTFKNSGLTVSEVTNEKGTIEVSVYKSEEPLNGRVRLIFRRNPFELKQWQVTDAQQIKTTVSLSNTKLNETLDDSLFVFKKPEKKSRPGDKGFRNRR